MLATGDFTGAFATVGCLLVGLVVVAAVVVFFGRDRRRQPVARAARRGGFTWQVATGRATALGKGLQIRASHS